MSPIKRLVAHNINIENFVVIYNVGIEKVKKQN